VIHLNEWIVRVFEFDHNTADLISNLDRSITPLVHGWTGPTSQSGPVFKTMDERLSLITICLMYIICSLIYILIYFWWDSHLFVIIRFSPLCPMFLVSQATFLNRHCCHLLILLTWCHVPIRCCLMHGWFLTLVVLVRTKVFLKKKLWIMKTLPASFV